MAQAVFDYSKQILGPSDVPFAELSAAFSRAWHEFGCNELYVRIAGHPVRICVAGTHWARIVSCSMGHLPRIDDDVEPVLTIDVWDANETGVRSPRSAKLEDAPPILMRTSDDGRYVGEERHHGAVWLNRDESRIVGFSESVARLNLDERARPFHKMLSAWLIDRGIQFVHAGLIAHENRGVLFVGNGGAGKSTSSIACLRDGMGYLGDDFLGLGIVDDRFVGYGIYASCLLNVDHIKRFPDLEALANTANYDDENKHVVYLSDAFPGTMRHEIGVDALVLPNVVDADVTTCRRASKSETLMAIAPTSVMFLPRPSKWAFERLTRLVESVPSYWLDLGRDVDQIPTAVKALVDGL